MHALVRLSRIKVFRPDSGAAKVYRAVQDHCIPVRDLVALLKVRRRQNVGGDRRMDPPEGQVTQDQAQFGKRDWGKFAGNNYVEFLEHLDTETAASRLP